MFSIFTVITWTPQPPQMLKFAIAIYPCWKEQRIERGGHPIILVVNVSTLSLISVIAILNASCDHSSTKPIPRMSHTFASDEEKAKLFARLALSRSPHQTR